MSEAHRVALELEQVGEVTNVRLQAGLPIDEVNAHAIGDELTRLVTVDGRRNLRLSFARVEYISSAALGMFIILNKKLNDLGGTLTLCDMDPQIYEVFEITKLNKLLNIVRE